MPIRSGVTVNLWVDTRYSSGSCGLPSYSTSGPLPYDLQVLGADLGGTFVQMQITRVGVRYQDGEQRSMAVTFTQPLAEGNKLDPWIRGVVARNVSCRITLTGVLVTAAGARQAFEVAEDFQHARNVRITTWWDHIAGC